MKTTQIIAVVSGVALLALTGCTPQETAEEPADVAETPVRSAFANEGLEFDNPVGTWESVRPDGTVAFTRHDADFKTRDIETGEVIGEWTVQGGLTCMIRTASSDRMTCFVVSENPDAPCPDLIGTPEGIEDVNCVVATPLREDGTRSLKSGNGDDRVVRRVES